MYISDNFYFSDYPQKENTYNLKKRHYIGLNRTANKEKNFLFNQIN